MTPVITISGSTQGYWPNPITRTRARRSRRRVGTVLGLALISCLPSASWAQGQDSATWSRDRQVIEALLPGFYSNANQAYFDGRRQVALPQDRHHISIKTSAQPHVFTATRTNAEGAVINEQR